ncbi:MAG: hypothetical protein NT091_00210, partial [Candidatus Falkowbacteria bacterium]|nr:hypothetical protein [Candidatus Falkowbacteria bacterium]
TPVTPGTLSVEQYSQTKRPDVLVMGSVDQELASFKFIADAKEDINISQLIISDRFTSMVSIKSLSLYDGATKIAGPIQFISTPATHDADGGIYVHAVFSQLGLVIPAGTPKILTVKGDVLSSANGAASGSTHIIAILAKPGLTSGPGMTAAIQAQGISSKANIVVSIPFNQYGSEMTVYRTKLTASWASDTPTGASSGSSAQTIAKINITNAANAGSYSATVSAMNFVISSTIVTAASTHALTVYKDAVGGTALATTNYAASQVFSGTSALPAFTTATEIAAGATKLFIVTLNTSDAASTKNLSVYVDTTGITWTDGTTSNTNVKSLPLVPKTLTY